MSDRKLTAELVLDAYAAGIFPMADSRDDPAIYWVEPRMRGIIPMTGLRVSRSLRKRLRKDDYRFDMNVDFAAVIDTCADRRETWINTTIRALMIDLHAAGAAHSFEVRDPAGRLIGGMYGLNIGGAFFGESMFSREREGSKIALVWAMDHLSRSGVTLFDTQFLTAHLASLGACEVPRKDYLDLLRQALGRQADIAGTPVERDRQALVQRMTQTS